MQRSIKSKPVPAKQVLRLLTISEGQHRRVVPRLQGTAAWAASLNQEVFQEILQIDPDVLLRSDLGTESLEQVVKQLLKSYDENKLLLDRLSGVFDDGSPKLHTLFSRLNHPDLADQLRPYLQDKTRNEATRRLAIEISEACRTRELESDWINIALGEDESFSLRVFAARAITEGGSGSTKERLKPLVLQPIKEDEDNYLKGFGLLACWPKYLSANELFQSLQPIQSNLIGGPFNNFLESDFVAHLKLEDLPVALDWVSKLELDEDNHIPFPKIVDDIVKLAWRSFEFSWVVEKLGKIELQRLNKHHQSLIGDEIAAAAATRRCFIEGLVSILGVPQDRDPYWAIFLRAKYVIEEDLLWLIDKIDQDTSIDNQQKFGQFVRAVFRKNHYKGNPVVNDLILAACERHSFLRELFSAYVNPVDLNSSEAKRLCEEYYESQKWTERPKKRHEKKPITPPPAEQIASILTDIETGDALRWWKIPFLLIYNEDGTGDGNNVHLDITRLPGWHYLDDATKGKITTSALLFLQQFEPNTSEWLESDSRSTGSIAAYQALYFLAHTSPQGLQSFQSEFWRKWVVVVLNPPFWRLKDDNPGIQKELVRLAYQHSPGEFISGLNKLIDKISLTMSCDFLLKRISICLDKRLQDVLFEKAKESALSSRAAYELLSLIYHQLKTEVVPYLHEIIQLPVSENGRNQEFVNIAGTLLLQNEAGTQWGKVWSILQKDNQFSKQFFERVALIRNWVWIEKLTECNLGDFYIWLVGNYPYEEDPQHKGEDTPTGRYEIMFLRQGVLNELKNRGTQLACDELQRIADAFPNLSFHWRYFIETQTIRRQKEWQPPSVTELFDLISHSEKRYVRNETELLEVVIESLDRLQIEMKGETSPVLDLWNEVNEEANTPKGENRFSDYVKRHLTQDLKKSHLIINREVEIRPRRSKEKPGEEVDILVETFLRRNGDELGDRIALIIESKGCWHQDLHTGMKEQLADRYLAENQCRVGLYLVGWFFCESWKTETDRETRRKDQAKRNGTEIGEMRQRLHNQARDLSNQTTMIQSYILDVTP